MEVGTEISQKIRSAIKAKLMELGSYVDDELPDYIMVMVANKKTKQQMTDDLSLFLGSNTDVFSTWLHGLLAKLQTVSGDPSKPETEKSKSSKDKKKEKHSSKSKDNVSGESKEKKRKASKKGDSDAPKAKSGRTASFEKEDRSSSTSVSLSKAASIPSADLSVSDKTLENNQSSDGNQDPKHSETIIIARERDAKSDDIEDVRQLLDLVTETPGDELAKELETTEVGIEKLASSRSRSNSAAKNTKETEVICDNEHINRSSHRESRAEISPPRKRKCPSSVVSAVRRIDNLGEDESTPAVASVVKVTSRKSNVPQSMQANSETVSSAEEKGSGDEAKLVDGRVSLDVVKQALSEVLAQWKEGEDDIRIFCKNIEKTLRKMSQGDLAISKLKIQKVLFDYEMAHHRQTSIVNNSRTQSSTSGLIVGMSKSVNQEIADTSYTRKLEIAGNPTASISVTHLNFPSASSQDNATKTKTKQRQNYNSKRFDSGASSSSCTELQKETRPLGEAMPDRIIFGPKSKEDGESSQPTDLRQSLDLKNASSVESYVSLSSTDLQSVTTAVSSTVIESSGFDSPSSSHPNSSVQAKCSTSSSSHSQKSQSMDSLQKTNNHRLHPTILVSSLHQNRRLGSDSPSVLRNSLSHDSPVLKNSLPLSAESVPDSSKEISPEQLKVLAKNLKITVVNKRALRPEGKSNSDESTSDDSEDESDSEEEEDSDEEVIEDRDNVTSKEPNDTSTSLKE